MILTHPDSRSTNNISHRRLVIRTKALLATLLRRAEFLPVDEKSLLRLRLEGNHSVRDLSRIFNRSPGQISRRIRTLIRRLRDPIVAAVIDFPDDLPDLHRRIALERFALGHAPKRIAREHQMSRDEVRQTLAYIGGWAHVAHRVWTHPMAAPNRNIPAA